MIGDLLERVALGKLPVPAAVPPVSRSSGREPGP